MKLQKIGGFAAIAGICTFIVVAVYANLIKSPGISSDPANASAVISANPGEFYVLNLLFILSSIFGLLMFIALHERMHTNATYLCHMMLIASSASVAIWVTESIINIKSIGIIVPTHDLSSYRIFYAIKEGLHFAGGHLCGWACLFLGCAILVTRSFPRILGWLFLITGALWIPTFFLVQIGFRYTIPIFALTLCVAFIWTGIALLRQKQPLPAV